MGRPSKNIEVLGEETGVETTETIEDVTAEVVEELPEGTRKEIEALKAKLEEKEKTILTLTESMAPSNRSKENIVKTIDGASGARITIYGKKKKKE